MFRYAFLGWVVSAELSDLVEASLLVQVMAFSIAFKSHIAEFYLQQREYMFLIKIV